MHCEYLDILAAPNKLALFCLFVLKTVSVSSQLLNASQIVLSFSPSRRVRYE